MPDTLKALIAAIEGVNASPVAVEDSDLMMIADKASLALPTLIALQPLADDLEGEIRRALERIKDKVDNEDGHCNDCEEATNGCCTHLCRITREEIGEIAISLTAELMAQEEK
jgi:hypothetical protein